MDNWTAEIINNSDDDYNLIIEILKNDNFMYYPVNVAGNSWFMLPLFFYLLFF